MERNLSVTKGALERALAIADVLTKAPEREGFSFEVGADKGVSWLKWLETGTRMQFGASEHVKRSAHVKTASEERGRAA